MLQENRLQREFWDACRSGRINLVELLLGRGSLINQAMQGGRVPLYIACQNGQLAVVELLLARGALIDQARDNGATPLFAACLHGQLEVVELLLAGGANVNHSKNNGSTPLSISCEEGYLAISELLISSNKFKGYTPEHLKLIILSCANGRHTGRANAMSFYIIAYRCYKQLQLIDPSYTPNDLESSVIERGQVQQERQTYMLLSLFFDHRKRRVENVLPEEVWRNVTTYLPLSWLRNEDNTTTHQSSMS